MKLSLVAVVEVIPTKRGCPCSRLDSRAREDRIARVRGAAAPEAPAPDTAAQDERDMIVELVVQGIQIHRSSRQWQMEDFSAGIHLGENEDEYQAALRQHSEGLVLALTRSRRGRFTLHRATCDTISYDLSTSKQGQRHRRGKLIFRDHTELHEWLGSRTDLALSDLNHCSRCMPSFPKAQS